jgi:hypothetical protein
LVITTVTRRSVSQRLISASSSTVQTIVLIPARWHCASTPAAARRRCTATQSARQARSLRIGNSSLSRVAARLLQVQVAGGLPGDRRHHVGHPRHRVAGQFAQPGVADGGQWLALAGARVVEGGEFTVGGPPDVEFDVLRAGRRGVRIRLDGAGPRAVRRNGRHLLTSP